MFSVVAACCVETVCSVFWLLCSANREAGCVAADGVEDVAHTWTDIEVRVIRSSPLLMTPTSANTQCLQPGLVGESGSTRTRSSYVLWQGTLPRPFSQLRGVLDGRLCQVLALKCRYVFSSTRVFGHVEEYFLLDHPGTLLQAVVQSLLVSQEARVIRAVVRPWHSGVGDVWHP